MLRKEVSKKQDEIDSLKTKNKEYQKKIKAQFQEIKKVKLNISELNRNKKQKKPVILKNQEIINKKENTIKQMKGNIKKQKTKSHKKTIKIAQLEKNNKDQKLEIESLNQKIQELDKQKTELQKSKDHEITLLKSVIDRLKNQIQQDYHDYENINKSDEDEMPQLYHQNSNTSDTYDEDPFGGGDNNSQLPSNISRRNSFEDRSQFRFAENNNNKRRDSISESDKIYELETKLANLDESNQSLQSHLNESKRANSELKSRYDQLLKKNKKLIKDHGIETNEFKTELSGVIKREKSLSNQNKALENKIKNLKKLELKYNDTLVEYNKYKELTSKYLIQLDKDEQEIYSLKKELEKLKEKNKILKQEYGNLILYYKKNSK